jgi:RHS repeat-associated protein
VRYLLSDGLGSVRQAVDETGAVVASYEFDPYGNPVNNIGGAPYGYTGEWYGGYIDLLYLRARWYAPYLNRFVSPDSIVPDFSNPQSLNRYSYAYNNPLRFLDPSGHDPEWVDWARGVSYEFANNMSFGGVDIALNVALGQGWQNNQSGAFVQGQRTGQALATVAGTVLVADGGSKAAGGVSIMAPTAGAAAACTGLSGGICSIPSGIVITAEGAVVVAGLAEAGYGAGVVFFATNNSIQSDGSTNPLQRATQSPDKNGFTRAGRALQKHGNRSGSPWQSYLPQGKLNPTNYNTQADDLIADILNNPDTTMRTRSTRYYGEVQEFFAPDGRGLRYNIDGNFLGFLDSP